MPLLSITTGLTIAFETLWEELVEHTDYLQVLLRPSIEGIRPAQVQCRRLTVDDAY